MRPLSEAKSRSIGTAIIQESGAPDLFPLSTTITIVNTTTSLSVSLQASITDFTGTESVICDQLLATIQ